MALAHHARGPQPARVEGPVRLRDVTRWGWANDPYAVILVIAVPLFILALALVLP